MTRSSRLGSTSEKAQHAQSASASRRPGVPVGDLATLLGRIAGPEIGQSASRVAGELARDVGFREDEIARHLIWIAGACMGEELEAAPNGATLTLRRRLLERIRQELVQGWKETAPDSAAMLETLTRLERAHRACDPTVDQVLTAELADHGGLDLVVEVAHDMRSPLTSILFLSEILHRDQGGSLSDVHRRQIGIIYSAALGLVGMASDMIEMAKGGNKLTELEAVPFSVNEILRGVHDLVRPTSEEKRLELKIQTLRAEHRIGYPVPLSRVLLNLTTNALKFTSEGGVEVSATMLQGTRIEFAVRDTGPGIEPESLHKLYQPFRRQANRETGFSFSGTGLGLAICRRLVNAMGSELQVESEFGTGTRFFFHLDLPPASTL